jgi:RNA polymerase sigma factor (sigma-70 family)
MLEKETLEQLFRSHYARMYNLARCILRDDEESKDVVSDVFAKVAEGKIKIDLNRAEPYLLVSVRNHCYDVISRKQIRERFKKISPIEPFSAISSEEERDEQLEDMLTFAENNFTEQTLRIFKMRFDEGRQYNEIASTLGISIPAVYKHLSQAIQKLKEHLTL